MLTVIVKYRRGGQRVDHETALLDHNQGIELLDIVDFSVRRRVRIRIDVEVLRSGHGWVEVDVFVEVIH